MASKAASAVWPGLAGKEAKPQRAERWSDKTRLEKIASAIYPHLLEPQMRGQMIAANEEQRTGIERRTSEGQRDYGVKPSAPLSALDRVPGLKRVEVPMSGLHPVWMTPA